MRRRVEGKRRGLFRLFKKSQEGVTAIEFALVGGPFLYLLCVIFEAGLMLFSEYVIQNGVAQAARMIRTGEVQLNGISASQFKTLVCGNLTRHLDCTNNLYIDIRKFPTFAAIALPSPTTGQDLSAAVTTNAQFRPGCPMEVVVVRAYYPWQLFFPGISQLANLTGNKRLLTAGAAFRNEPFPWNSAVPCP
jgi:Flp pilus assembly protein TadG